MLFGANDGGFNEEAQVFETHSTLGLHKKSRSVDANCRTQKKRPNSSMKTTKAALQKQLCLKQKQLIAMKRQLATSSNKGPRKVTSKTRNYDDNKSENTRSGIHRQSNDSRASKNGTLIHQNLDSFARTHLSKQNGITKGTEKSRSKSKGPQARKRTSATPLGNQLTKQSSLH